MTWILVATWLVRAVGAYLALGLLFALPFVARGIERVDPGAHGAGWGFRLIVLPGTVAFWPLLLSRWLRGGGLPVEVNAHRRAAGPGSEGRRMIRSLRRRHRLVWLLLAFALPALLAVAVLYRRAVPRQDLPPALARDASASDDAATSPR